jgi:rRNA maturation endonuclease Nob1
VGIHHVLMHEAGNVDIGAPRVCAHCSHLVPMMSFCPQCGVADRAIARPRREQGPTEQFPPDVASAGAPPEQPG